MVTGVLLGVTACHDLAARRADLPFRVLVQQHSPRVTLFEHRPSGVCFVAYHAGGLVVVDSSVCQKSGGALPIGPPGLPVSPEK